MLEFYSLCQVDKVPEGITAIGSTEVLESVFGKQKEVSHQPRGSLEISSNTLSIPLYVGEKLSESEVKKGLEATSCTDFYNWSKNIVGETMSSLRKKIFGHRKKAAVI